MRPTLKGRQHYDEKYLKVKKKDCYDLNCIDSNTKYITAHLTVDKRTKEKCIAFLSQIKKTCYEQILAVYQKEKNKKVKDRELIEFICDGFHNYRKAFNKLFYHVAKLAFGVPIACKKFGLEHNNNPIERHNGKLKGRVKIMRGGFRSFLGAEAFMNLTHIVHNFVDSHSGLGGKTPAEAAEIKLPLRGNRLLSLIQYWARRR